MSKYCGDCGSFNTIDRIPCNNKYNDHICNKPFPHFDERHGDGKVSWDWHNGIWPKGINAEDLLVEKERCYNNTNWKSSLEEMFNNWRG